MVKFFVLHTLFYAFISNREASVHCLANNNISLFLQGFLEEAVLNQLSQTKSASQQYACRVLIMSTVLKEVTRKMQEKDSPALIAVRDGDGDGK